MVVSPLYCGPKNTFFRAAFKFGRRVHFALRRNMLKSPIARLPAILLDFINCPIGETDWIYEANVKWNSMRPLLISIHVNSKHEWRKWPLKLISACLLMLFCLACNSVPKTWHICANKGHTYFHGVVLNREAVDRDWFLLEHQLMLSFPVWG